MLEWFASMALMYGLIAWVAHDSVKSTQTTIALLKQPLQVDPFDCRPFEPIGRQSILLALAFVGCLTLSLLFSGIQPSTLVNPVAWLLYVPAILTPVVLFFLPMYPAARAIARARDAELCTVRAHLFGLCRKLRNVPDDGAGTTSLSAQISALAVHEQHLLEARTWPYETTALRRLFVSVLLPGLTLNGKVVIEILC